MIPAGFHVPRRTQVSLSIHVEPSDTGLSPSSIPFPWDSPDSSCHLYRRSYNPGLCPVWALPLSLAATYGIDFFLFLQVLRCFSSLRIAPVMTVVMRSPLLERRGFPIRISAGHRVLTARRRISLFVASFIASLCPGILRTPFLP